MHTYKVINPTSGLYVGELLASSESKAFRMADTFFGHCAQGWIIVEIETQCIYQRKGYHDRKDYLWHVAKDYDVPVKTVLELAGILGPDEDFDGLISMIEEYHC